MVTSKFPLLLAALLLAMVTPISFAARNEVVPFPLNTITNDVGNNIRNPFANIFMLQKPVANCVPAGEPCPYWWSSETCCSGKCILIVDVCASPE